MWLLCSFPDWCVWCPESVSMPQFLRQCRACCLVVMDHTRLTPMEIPQYISIMLGACKKRVALKILQLFLWSLNFLSISLVLSFPKGSPLLFLSPPPFYLHNCIINCRWTRNHSAVDVRRKLLFRFPRPSRTRPLPYVAPVCTSENWS